jgi:rhodanese-related sulfurtransferase/transcriptional regulator with XRE-family HTH domain
MIKTLAPHDAEAMLAAGGVDLIDVREPDEFATGHVPRARNVPLAELKAKANDYVREGATMFVCAKGARSNTAAEAAEALGRGPVYQIGGGTHAWRDAGLPIEAPQKRTPASTASEPEIASEAESNEPGPAVDAVVGANLRELRTKRGISLDDLARRTGLSRSLLGQVELGKAQASVSVVWRIAQAFEVHFSALLATPQRTQTTVLRSKDAKRLVSPDGRFSSRALYPFGEKPDAEFYELFLAAHSREDAEAHQPGTRENLIVTAGSLELHVGTGAAMKTYELATGDAIVFIADVPHSYINPSKDECWMYLVMTYA